MRARTMKGAERRIARPARRVGTFVCYALAFFAFSERICFVHSRMASSEPGETFFCHFSNRCAAFQVRQKQLLLEHLSRLRDDGPDAFPHPEELPGRLEK